jgi:hypothetical protein
VDNKIGFDMQFLSQYSIRGAGTPDTENVRSLYIVPVCSGQIQALIMSHFLFSVLVEPKKKKGEIVCQRSIFLFHRKMEPDRNGSSASSSYTTSQYFCWLCGLHPVPCPKLSHSLTGYHPVPQSCILETADLCT